MQGQNELLKLCGLIVDVFEVETRKAEHDIIDKICDFFKIDLSSIEKKFRKKKKIAPTFLIRKKMRTEVAQRLSNEAISCEALLSAVLKSGAGFLDMIDDIYAFLSKCSATTEGTSEEFKFKLGDVDLNISISPAFIETIRSYERAIINLQIGTINYDQLSKFLGIDGDYYGVWPLRSPGDSDSHAHEQRVARDITYLPWLKSQIDSKRGYPGWDKIKRAFYKLSYSVEMFIKESNHLIDAHIRSLCSQKEIEQDEIILKNSYFKNWEGEKEKQEREFYLKTGCLRAGINPKYFGFKSGERQQWLSVDINKLFKGPHFLSSSPMCVSVLNENPYSNFYDRYIGGLACLCGIWKSGLHRKPSNDEKLGELLINDEVEKIQNWLDDLNKKIIEITNWLANTIWQPKYTVDKSVIYESLEKYLNLPLWRERWQLYEIWLMCTTLETVGSNGWSICIDLKPRVTGNASTWILPKGIAKKPCGRLFNLLIGNTFLEVWYQSNHLRNNTKIMPDIAIRTPMPFAQDLVIVEAKDRYRMPTKSIPNGALPVGKHYMMHSLASVIWVVNYCKFSGTLLSDPKHNHGDAWHNLFFASEMKPKNIPLNFQETIGNALLPAALRTINDKMQKKRLSICN